ncbi:complement factor H-like [Argonauta hians]
MKVSLTVSEGIPEMSISCNKETHTPADNVTTVLCLNDKWLPFSPKCKPNSCKVPDLARGIYRTTADGRIPPGSEIEHGQTIYAKCESGYRTESNFYFTTCKYGQLKNIDRIACKEKGCKPPRPTNGVFEPRISDTEDSLWIAGSQVSVMCQDGFTPNNGIGAATCLRGSWQPYQPSCIPKYCEVPMVENGYFLYGNHKKIVDHHIKNGTSIKILCESNHNATGPNTVLCSYGHWLPATPACQKYSCLPLQNSTTSPLVLLQDSHPQTTTTTSRTLMVADSGFEPVYHGLYYAHGTTVRLVCDLSKYKPRNGVTTSTCFDGRWTVKDLRCQPLPCLPPKNDSHSPLSLIGAPTPLLLHSTVVQLHCDRRKSFPLDNNVQAVCQYGQWTPTHLQCIPRPCVLPEFRETTYLYLNAEPVKNYTVASGVYIHVVCDKPHLVPTVALCHYGSWYLPIRSCFDGSCYLSEKETIDSWTDTISGETSVRSYTHNSTSIRISCKRNYRLRNETNRFTCLEGQWKPFEPYCEEDPVVSNLVPGTRPVCRHPEQGDNVVFVWDSVSPKDFGNNIIADGTSFHAHCSDVGNFQLMGSDFLSCHNGIWYGRLPVCQKTEEDELAPPRIYINVSTSWSSEREQYMVTANGSVVISPGDRLQLGCAHNLYSPTDLEWVPPNESVPVPEYTSENIALNVTGIRLHISHFTARNAGQYICRIKNTSLHHFVWFVIL